MSEKIDLGGRFDLNSDDDGALRALVGVREPAADDLSTIEGIGPKISRLLQEAGITTFADLAATDPSRIKAILGVAGKRYATAVPTTWPEQATLAANGRWMELEILQGQLKGGRRYS